MNSLPFLRRRRCIGIATLIACSLMIAACGSTDTATSTNAVDSASGGAVSPGASSEQVTAAQDFVDKWLAAPTAIGVTTPLNSRPPQGKTIVFTQCDFSQCKTIGDGVRDAAAAVGWEVQTISYEAANPATLVDALRQGLQYNPAAVVLTSLPYETWSSVVPDYQAAGIPLIPIYTPAVPIDDTIIANLAGEARYKLAGQLIGNWFIADSQGKGEAILNTVPGYELLKTFSDSVQATVQAGCPDCKITNIDSSIPDLNDNKIVPALVSALQRQPSATYVLLCDAAFVPGLPAALQAAGIENIKIAGDSADTQNGQHLLDGTSSAFSALPIQYSGWLAVDVALRHMQNISFPVDDGGLPMQLLTKDTVGTPSNDFTLPSDYQEQFKKLWLVA